MHDGFCSIVCRHDKCALSRNHGVVGRKSGIPGVASLVYFCPRSTGVLREDHSVDEVWVVSSEEVAPINLAATLKQDRSDRCVCLVSFESTGSLRSRSSVAGIDAFLTRKAFADRYALRKQRSLNGGGVASGNVRDEKPTEINKESTSCQRVDEKNKVDMTGVRDKSEVGTNAQAVVTNATETETARQRAIESLHSPQLSNDPLGLPAKRVAPRTHSHASVQIESALQSTAQNTGAFLLPVVSGSGGAGKSTVAALCALLSQRLGYRTLLLDFDLQFGDMPALLGVDTPLTIDELIASPARMDQLVPSDGRPALLAAPKHLERSEVVVGEAPALIEHLRKRFDVIVANTGAAWAEQHAVLLERCSKTLFLVDQRSSSLRACRRALDMCARCGIAAGPFLFAVNRCTKSALFASIDVSCALQGTHVVELSDGGSDVEELLGAGLPMELLGSRNDLCASIETVLRDLLPDSATAQCIVEPSPKRSLWSRKGSKRRRRKEAACL